MIGPLLGWLLGARLMQDVPGRCERGCQLEEFHGDEIAWGSVVLVVSASIAAFACLRQARLSGQQPADLN